MARVAMDQHHGKSFLADKDVSAISRETPPRRRGVERRHTAVSDGLIHLQRAFMEKEKPTDNNAHKVRRHYPSGISADGLLHLQSDFLEEEMPDDMPHNKGHHHHEQKVRRASGVSNRLIHLQRDLRRLTDNHDFETEEFSENGIPKFIFVDLDKNKKKRHHKKRELKKASSFDSRLKRASSFGSHHHAGEDRRATAVSYSLVDLERDKHGRRALKRSRELHQLAQEHAIRMAERQEAFHAVSTLDELRELLECPTDVCHNVLCGTCAVEIHRSAMAAMSDKGRDKLINQSYREYGISAAYGKNGHVFVCQYFRAKRADA